jgi:hypothetical protein
MKARLTQCLFLEASNRFIWFFNDTVDLRIYSANTRCQTHTGLIQIPASKRTLDKPMCTYEDNIKTAVMLFKPRTFSHSTLLITNKMNQSKRSKTEHKTHFKSGAI